MGGSHDSLDGTALKFIDKDAAWRRGQSKVLDLVEGSGLFAFLSSRSAPSAIIADEKALDLLRSSQETSNAAALYSTSDIMDRGILNPVAGPYYILTENNEIAVKARLRLLLASAGRGPEILGALNDVMPILLSGRIKPLGDLESAWSSYRTAARYMVLCAPRSGSEFVTRNLEANGVGSPREHITPHVYQPLSPVNGARPGGLDFIYWLVKLVHNASVSGIFGSKMISHYHRSLATVLRPEERAFFEDMMSGSCLLYLYRSDKLLQALSLDRARITRFWHSYGSGDMAAYHETAKAWDYDFARISRVVRFLAQEERYTHELWMRYRNERAMSACYETLDMASVRRQLVDRLGKAPVMPERRIGTRQLRDEKTAEYAERFLTDYRKHYVQSNADTHVPLRTDLLENGGKLVASMSQ
jgi:LPS sulfotransferase NodH